MPIIDGARLDLGPLIREKMAESQALLTSGNPDKAAIAKLSEEFEAVFTEIMLKSMRDSVPKSELIDGGNGEEIFRSMLDSQYAKDWAGQRRSGLAESIERQLLGVETEKVDLFKASEGLRVYGNKAP